MTALLLLLALAASPLKECSDASPNRIAVGPCLERKLGVARTDLSAVVQAVRVQMKGLDAATGRPVALGAFDRSQEAFAGFLEANCDWLAAQLSAGTGAGDVARDCMIRMTRARAEELREQVAGAGRGARPEPPPAAGPAGLTGHAWRLTRLVRDGKEVAPAAGPAPSIQFDQAGRVSGDASVNRFSGSATIDASGALQWGQPGFATTRMAGPPELMDQERWFLDALGCATRLRLDEDTLILEDERRTAVLIFRR